jgi:hypothetical protein
VQKLARIKTFASRKLFAGTSQDFREAERENITMGQGQSIERRPLEVPQADPTEDPAAREKRLQEVCATCRLNASPKSSPTCRSQPMMSTNLLFLYRNALNVPLRWKRALIKIKRTLNLHVSGLLKRKRQRAKVLLSRLVKRIGVGEMRTLQEICRLTTNYLKCASL